jgi:hypothetical protein
MNWGKSIVLAFVLFAGFIAVIVTICMRQDVNLVSSQYYKDDLAYQQQLDRKNNTEALEEKPVIVLTADQLQVSFPEKTSIDGGSVKVFRPSNDKLDQYFGLKASDESIQVFPVKELTSGAYRVKMTWVVQGTEYYIEEFVVI